MAKTTIQIPKIGAVITCRNKREAFAARVFVNEMNSIVDDALRGQSYGLRAVDEYEGLSHWRIKNLDGQTSAFYFMDMIAEPISCVDIADAVRAMYLEALAADNAAAPADEDDDSEKYMDEIKADAAYCLGIEYGSDEWYALAEI